MKRFLITTLISAAAATAIAQSPAPRDAGMPETVSVTGTGRATLTPDRFTFTVGVQTIAATVDEAVNQNNAKVSAVVAALKKAGATEAEIRTSNFSIWPQQDYSQGQLPKILGYQVSNNITVTKKQVGEAGKLLQVAVSNGVNQSSGLQFEVSDPARGRDQGMRAAMDDAKAKATLLATAAGRTLGRAIAISEGTQPVAPPMPYPMARMAKAEAVQVSDVPVESGTQEMSYTVSVIYEMR